MFENYPTAINLDGADESLGLDIQASASEEHTNFALTLLVRKQETLTIEADYWSDEISDESVSRMLAQFQEILINIVNAKLDAPVSRISIIPDDERVKLIYNWNETKVSWPDNICIHQLFEDAVMRNPNKVAVVSQNESLSYRELNDKSNQIAHFLVNQGVEADSVIALCFLRSIEMIVAILAVLKSGAAYLPLDPDTPQARLDYMLDDSSVKTILSMDCFEKLFLKQELNVHCLDDHSFNQQVEQQDTNNLMATGYITKSNSLAYVLYTSGSTGVPKGVMIEHGALVNRINWMHNKYGLTPEEKILQKTPYSFDVSVWELSLIHI